MTATHLHFGRRPARLSRHDAALDALSDAGHWLLATLREWHRRSRQRAELAGLDSRMLQDIGLTPAEREILANKPFWKE